MDKPGGGEEPAGEGGLLGGGWERLGQPPGKELIAGRETIAAVLSQWSGRETAGERRKGEWLRS